MEIITSYYTDVGTTKQINQDSLSVKVVNSPDGKIVFALVCDGMGGLEQGELASKEVVVAFNDWFATDFASMVVDHTFSEDKIYKQWKQLICKVNQEIGYHAAEQGIMMGTTLSALLIYKGWYYICHVGDSRIYMIEKDVEQITEDQTVVAQEIEMGRIKKEQALKDPRRSILLQCIGASQVIEPQFESGIIRNDVTFLLASDGFVHLISEEEIYKKLQVDRIKDKEYATEVCQELTILAMQRGERDNITVVVIAIKEIE